MKMFAMTLLTVLVSQTAFASEGFFVCTDVKGRIFSGEVDGEVNIRNAKVQNVSDTAGTRPTRLEPWDAQSLINGNVSLQLVEPGEEEQMSYRIKATKNNGTSDAVIEQSVGDTPPARIRASCTVKFKSAP